MKRIPFAEIVAGALALSWMAAIGSGQGAPAKQEIPEIKDKAGNLWVRNYSRMRYQKLPNSRANYVVKASPGKRIFGTWTKEGMDVEVGDLNLNVLEKGGTYELESAVMGGTIQATFTRPSANAESKSTQTAIVNAGSAEYIAAKNTVDVSGAVTMEQQDPGTNQHMTASGSSGLIQLSKPGTKGNVVQRATLRGPVVMKLKGTRKGDDGKPQPFNVNGWADQMVFTDAEHTIVFTGHVKITGDDPSIGGEITGVQRVVISFSAKGEIESIDMEADPGKTVITDKRNGGGKR